MESKRSESKNACDVIDSIGATALTSIALHLHCHRAHQINTCCDGYARYVANETRSMRICGWFGKKEAIFLFTRLSNGVSCEIKAQRFHTTNKKKYGKTQHRSQMDTNLLATFQFWIIYCQLTVTSNAFAIHMLKYQTQNAIQYKYGIHSEFPFMLIPLFFFHVGFRVIKTIETCTIRCKVYKLLKYF